MKRHRRRRPEGCVYRRGRLFWLKWTDAFGRTHYRSSGSQDRDAAENMLREELKRRRMACRRHRTHAEPW